MSEDEEVWVDPLHRLDAEEEPRPFIRTLDEPLDPDWDEAFARMGGPDRHADVRRLQEMGFAFVPLKTNKKSPPIGVIKDKVTWAQAIKATNIIKTLNNPGTQNAAMTPPPGVVGLDADDGWAVLREAKEAELGPLPPTLTVVTPNGEHLFYRWPKTPNGDLPEPHGPWWGQVVARWDFRTTTHDGGYTVAPGSYWDGLGSAGKPVPGKKAGSYTVYRTESGDDFAIAELPEVWARDVLSSQLLSNPLETQVASGPLAEPRGLVAAGQRHDYLRDKAAWLARTGVRGDALFPAIWSIYEKTCEPYGPGYDAKVEVLRAIGDVEQFGIDDAEDVVREPDNPEPDLSRIVGIADYRASQPSIIPWAVKDLVYYGGVTLLSGPPKAGKSTLLAQMQSGRESGARLFGSLAVDRGPSLLVTEEGGLPVVYKTGGLRSLDVLDRKAAAGLTFTQVLRLIEAWGDDKPRAMVFIDTLSVWAGVVDENSASEMTRVLGAVELMAQMSGLAVVLAHHTRKAGGSDGEGIRGSGATFAVVDISAEFSRVATGSDQRLLDVTGRVLLPQRYRLDFERVGHSYVLEDTAVMHDTWLESVPTSGSGLSLEELRDLWGQDPRRRVDELLSADRLSRDLVTEGRAKKYRYLRVD